MPLSKIATSAIKPIRKPFSSAKLTAAKLADAVGETAAHLSQTVKATMLGPVHTILHQNSAIDAAPPEKVQRAKKFFAKFAFFLTLGFYTARI